MHKILIVEDDRNIREGLEILLKSEGYETATAADGEEALRIVNTGLEACATLVLLDIMMPKKNGFDVCRELRAKHPDLPVIFLTAKGEEIDKVLAFGFGADDYIVKPFGNRELLARVAAVLRRSAANIFANTATAQTDEHFKIGADLVDARRFTLTAPDGNVAPLTEKEVRLLAYFNANPGVVLRREKLLDEVWGVSYSGGTRTLDQHISQLRKKLSNPALIETVHWAGYKLRVES